jgi:hypothetical protein
MERSRTSSASTFLRTHRTGVLIGANFGLLVSEDDGLTWHYACEPWIVAGSNAALANNSVSFYQVTLDGAFLATSVNLTRSSDVACTWPVSTGAVTGQRVADIFPDPNDASFVLAIVVLLNPTTITSYLLASHDGGKTFGPEHLYETADLLTGVRDRAGEAGRGLPDHHLALRRLCPFPGQPSDRGVTWTTTNIPVPSATEPRILTVDPDDEKKVYLRGDGCGLGLDADDRRRRAELPDDPPSPSGPCSRPSSGPETGPLRRHPHRKAVRPGSR